MSEFPEFEMDAARWMNGSRPYLFSRTSEIVAENQARRLRDMDRAEAHAAIRAPSDRFLRERRIDRAVCRATTRCLRLVLADRGVPDSLRQLVLYHWHNDSPDIEWPAA